MNEFGDNYIDYYLEDTQPALSTGWVMYMCVTFVVGLMIVITKGDWMIPYTPPLCIAKKLSDITGHEEHEEQSDEVDDDVDVHLNVLYDPYEVYHRHRNRRYIDNNDDDILISTSTNYGRMMLENRDGLGGRDLHNLPFAPQDEEEEDILKLGYELIGIPCQQVVNDIMDIE